MIHVSLVVDKVEKNIPGKNVDRTASESFFFLAKIFSFLSKHLFLISINQLNPGLKRSRCSVIEVNFLGSLLALLQSEWHETSVPLQIQFLQIKLIFIRKNFCERTRFETEAQLGNGP